MDALIEWVHFSDRDDFWTITVFVILAGIGGLIGNFYFLLRKWAIESIPTSQIRSAAQGYLELCGHCKNMEGSQIIAPLTGTPCTWYTFSVHKRQRSGRKSSWAQIEKATSDELFLIVDDTGQCIIDPEGASVEPVITETWFGTTPRPQTGRRAGRWFNSANRYRYTEKRMHAGDDLYAIGLYKTVGGANTDFNTNAQVIALLKEWKTDSDKLLASYDNDNDGEIDINEWEAVREAAMQNVMNHHQELQSMPAVNIMGPTHDRRRPYILSAIPQNDLINRYNYYSAGLVTLFLLAGLFAIWAINTRLYQ